MSQDLGDVTYVALNLSIQPVDIDVPRTSYVTRLLYVGKTKPVLNLNGHVRKGLYENGSKDEKSGPIVIAAYSNVLFPNEVIAS